MTQLQCNAGSSCLDDDMSQFSMKNLVIGNLRITWLSRAVLLRFVCWLATTMSHVQPKALGICSPVTGDLALATNTLNPF